MALYFWRNIYKLFTYVLMLSCSVCVSGGVCFWVQPNVSYSNNSGGSQLLSPLSVHKWFSVPAIERTFRAIYIEKLASSQLNRRMFEIIFYNTGYYTRSVRVEDKSWATPRCSIMFTTTTTEFFWHFCNPRAQKRAPIKTTSWHKVLSVEPDPLLK